MPRRFFILAGVFFRLGAVNITRVLVYWGKLKLGFFERSAALHVSSQGPLFLIPDSPCDVVPTELSQDYIEQAEKLLLGLHHFFSSHSEYVGCPPRWRQWDETCNGQHWTKVCVNTVVGQDVKRTWDLSRFQWMPSFAAAFAASGDKRYFHAINTWFEDWSDQNSPNTGVNWVCAQEVSIRLINILNTSYLLGMHSSADSEVLQKTIVEHCQRIYPTIGYALAQENNHGISEAAALFVAGNWLEVASSNPRELKLGSDCRKRGRRLLEKLLDRLVLEDGGFAMSSFAYHRVVLDTLSIVEFWREALKISKFSKRYYVKASLLVDFLYQMHDATSGDVPNIGANDGSRAYLLTKSDYRDFRPSLQLASAYFSKSMAFKADRIEWYSATLPQSPIPAWPQFSRLYKRSGFMTLRDNDGDSWALLRFPSFAFRPAHSDSLHFDLWWQGRNILSDSGSYSYNCPSEEDDYFSGAAGHNVIQFDGRESMPRISKFLWGAWPEADYISDIARWEKEKRWLSGFTDYLGANHDREISRESDGWLIVDQISGFSKAVLRFHLENQQWSVEGNVIESEDIRIVTRANCPISIRLVQGWKSLYYSQRVEIPVLEIMVESSPAEVTTEIKLIG